MKYAEDGSYGQGQLRALLKALDEGVEISLTDITARVSSQGTKFSSESFHPQLRALKKPDNGGYCIKLRKSGKESYYTLTGKHGKVGQCGICGFRPYHRLYAEDAIALLKAAQEGEFKTVETYMQAFLKNRGLMSLIEPEEPVPDFGDLLGDDW